MNYILSEILGDYSSLKLFSIFKNVTDYFLTYANDYD